MSNDAPSPGPRSTPRTICEDIGQGRILQCVRPGNAWPAHIPNPPAFEQRCTRCDHIKPREVVERLDREWKERWGDQGRPTGIATKTETEG
jgi:hypothetical protein